jgi:hypothetical protein
MSETGEPPPVMCPHGALDAVAERVVDPVERVQP